MRMVYQKVIDEADLDLNSHLSVEDFIPKIAAQCPTAQCPTAVSHSTLSHSALSHSTVSHSTLSHSTVSHSTLSHSTVPHSTLSHSTVSHSTVSHSTLSHSTVSHSTVTVSHSTVSHSAVSHSTLSHSAVSHSTVSHSTVFHSTVSHPAQPNCGNDHTNSSGSSRHRGKSLIPQLTARQAGTQSLLWMAHREKPAFPFEKSTIKIQHFPQGKASIPTAVQGAWWSEKDDVILGDVTGLAQLGARGSVEAGGVGGRGGGGGGVWERLI
ncbi:hypothetical protein JZ751_015529 [Albula glossodonta]|uniref:Uncharacterized protein n=1 Tax=Albula glossodonta TaxID=121402 RepID=A0A8T2N323_9TELE|nr:hypothetical protein JZ751_015529 [Albula glossodonta]